MSLLPQLTMGIIFYSTGDPAHNTSAPTGSLTDSGWQYQGTWGAFLGTAIASNYFITAHHVGGAVGDRFQFRSTNYITTAFFDDPSSDLRLWRICGTFPDHAPIYSKSNELMKAIVVFGRGTQRGGEVIVSGTSGPSLKGWLWGLSDGVQRWGANVVSSIVNADSVSSMPLGDFLKCNFDAGGGAEEAHLSVGDSGGGVFIRDGGVWKLAGINYSVDGPYNTSTNGEGFAAAIFDESGLYTRDAAGKWVLTPDLSVDVPGGFYATRVAAHLDWINSIIQSPFEAPAPMLLSATAITGPYQPSPGAVVDPRGKTITVPVPSSPQFYLLDACPALHIKSINISGPNLVMTYE